MVAESSTREFTFIVATDRKKPDGKTRKLIRREVMKGKNKGRILPPRKRKQENPRFPKEDNNPEIQTEQQTSSSPLPWASSSSVPARVGSDMSLCLVAGECVDASVLTATVKFAMEVKPTMFVLHAQVDFTHDPQGWSEALATDPAYLHGIISISHSYLYSLSGSEITSVHGSQPIGYYLSSCLRVLRERLAIEDDSLKLADSTMMAILCLALHANRARQHETSRQHLEGLRKIIELRGGLRSMRENSKLVMEIFRCDITLALDSGLDPIFFHDPQVEPFMPYLDQLSGFLPPGCCLPWPADSLGISDPRLLRAWETTATFCSLVEHAAIKKRMIPEQTLLNTMASVMYRLFAMHDLVHSGLDGALRLGLLGFCSGVFVQWAKVRIPYQHLSHLYRECLWHLRNTGQATPHAILWLLFIGHIFIFRAESELWLVPWICDAIQACGLKTWGEVQVVLHNYMWIGCVHDKVGKAIFDQASIIDFEG